MSFSARILHSYTCSRWLDRFLWSQRHNLDPEFPFQCAVYALKAQASTMSAFRVGQKANKELSKQPPAWHYALNDWGHLSAWYTVLQLIGSNLWDVRAKIPINNDDSWDHTDVVFKSKISCPEMNKQSSCGQELIFTWVMPHQCAFHVDPPGAGCSHFEQCAWIEDLDTRHDWIEQCMEGSVVG